MSQSVVAFSENLNFILIYTSHFQQKVFSKSLFIENYVVQWMRILWSLLDQSRYNRSGFFSIFCQSETKTFFIDPRCKLRYALMSK